MAYWHKVKINENGWVFPPKTGSRVGVYFHGHNVRKAPFQGHFLRYEGEAKIPAGPFPHWRRNPEGWFELHPQEPLFASSMEEAKLKFQPLLRLVEEGNSDALFEKRPYQPPVRPQFIKDIEHSTHLAKARIVQLPDGLYSVSYLVYAPNGRYFPASTPSLSTDLHYEWGVTCAKDAEGQRSSTLADDLASAEEIASIELNACVAQDPEIKRR